MIVRLALRTLLAHPIRLAVLLKLRESVLTGAFGIVCLGSLLAHRPVMFYLARTFATGGDENALADKIGHDWKNPQSYDAHDGSVVDW